MTPIIPNRNVPGTGQPTDTPHGATMRREDDGSLTINFPEFATTPFDADLSNTVDGKLNNASKSVRSQDAAKGRKVARESRAKKLIVTTAAWPTTMRQEFGPYLTPNGASVDVHAGFDEGEAVSVRLQIAQSRGSGTVTIVGTDGRTLATVPAPTPTIGTVLEAVPTPSNGSPTELNPRVTSYAEFLISQGMAPGDALAAAIKAIN